MRRKLNKRGQQTMGLPFGVIFALFLIIVFVVIAFIAVGYFLDIGRSSEIGLFYEDFQAAIDDAWAGQSSETTFEINLPSAIDKICFANLSAAISAPGEDYNEIKDYEFYDSNVFLLPTGSAEGMPRKTIDHLNIEEITSVKNPYCVDVDQGLTIKKGFYDKLVVVQ